MLYEDENQEEQPKKKKKFRLFDPMRDGKGVSKEDVYLGHDLKGFFISLKLHFGQLIPVNLIKVFGNFPIFFAIAGISGLFRTYYYTPHNVLFMNFGGLLADNGGDSVTEALRMLLSVGTEASAMTITNYVFIALALLTAFTFGCVNTGTTYVIRELVRGNPTFIAEDFIHTVKTNFKQAFGYGIIDFFMMCIIPYNLVSFFSQEGFFMNFLFWTMVIISLFYLSMRQYIYLQIVTFDLPLRKIVKNALIFTLYNIKRNLLAMLGTFIVAVITMGCFFTAITVPLGIASPLLFLFALIDFMCMYAAFFNVEDTMAIKPEETESAEVTV